MTLPEWIDSEAWDGYEEMRRKIRKPMTDRARSMAVRELERLKADGYDPNAVLDQSTFNSWQGLFELREKVSKKDTTALWLEFRAAIRDGRLPANIVLANAVRSFGGLHRLGGMNTFELDRKRQEFDQLVTTEMRKAA